MDMQSAHVRCVPVIDDGAMDDPDEEMTAHDKFETSVSVEANSLISHTIAAPCYGY